MVNCTTTNEVSEAYFSEVLFAIIPSVPVSLILNLPFPTLPAAGLEAVQGQKHRSNSLVHNNTAANKEEQRSSCSNPNSWRCKKHRLTRALTSTTWFSVPQHKHSAELCQAAISMHPSGSMSCALMDNACSLPLSPMNFVMLTQLINSPGAPSHKRHINLLKILIFFFRKQDYWEL